jgi:uncharacterized membrane protein
MAEGNGAGHGARAAAQQLRDKAKPSGQKRQSGSRSSLAKNKHIIEEFISVGVPNQVAYDQWTQYREWSKIFKKESAEQKENRNGSDRGEDDNQVTVTAKIGPSKRQWQAEVVSQEPGRRIEWEAKGGVQAKGVVTFHRLDDRLTHLQVVIHYVPSGFMETIGNFLRMQRRRVRKDLKLFKNFIDLRGKASASGPGRVRGEGLRESLDEELGQAQRSEHQEAR